MSVIANTAPCHRYTPVGITCLRSHHITAYVRNTKDDVWYKYDGMRKRRVTRAVCMDLQSAYNMILMRCRCQQLCDVPLAVSTEYLLLKFN